MTKLILFPYAGALGLAYNQWLKRLEQQFLVLRIAYNDLKSGTSQYDCLNWDELMDKLFEKLKSTIKEGDYIFFGHSMGSRVEYEMYRKIVEKKLPLPKIMIISGCKVFTEGVIDPTFISEEEFRKKCIKLGGISNEVLEIPELTEIVFNELIRDIKILSQFQFFPVKIESPVIVLNGDDDEFSTKEEWEEILKCKVDWRLYEGNHFFIYKNKKEILEELCNLDDKNY